MSDAQQVPAIVILGQGALDTARRVQARYPGALVHGLAGRVEADRSYTDFGDTLRELYCADRPIVAPCAAGIVIRSLAPLLQRKGAEPPVLALAEDGSAVVPLLGGLAGVNRLAREIGEVLAVVPAITTSGELRFGTCVLNPPAGYVLADLEQGKRFVADLLGGQPVRVEGAADWLDAARLPRDPEAALAIHVTPSARAPRAEELLIHPRCVLAALEPADAAADAVRQALVDAGLAAAALGGLLADSARMADPRLQAAADALGVPLRFLPQTDPAARLRQALPAAEQVGDRLAVAAAPLAMDRIGQRRGRLTVIGLGRLRRADGACGAAGTGRGRGHPRLPDLRRHGRTLPRWTGAAWQRQPRGIAARPACLRTGGDGQGGGAGIVRRPRRVRHGRRGAGSPAWRWRAGLGRGRAADLPWRLGGLATAARAGRLWATISACCRCPTTSSPGR